MSKWYRKITRAGDDFSPVAEALDYFEAEHAEAENELKVKGQRIEAVAAKIPGIVEYRFAQLQEVEAILSYLELRAERAQHEAKRRFIENYARELTERQAEKWAEQDDIVYAIRLLANEVALVRNKLLSITKGLEYLHFQLSNITRLRVAGIEDATL